jgi:hypothetical protein
MSTHDPMTKGANLVMLVRALRSQRELARKVLPARLQKYLSERVLPTRWYPEQDFMDILTTLGKIDPVLATHWATMGQIRAAEDVKESFKPLLHLGDPQRTIAGAAILWRSYHDTGEVVVVPQSRQSATVHLRDFPIRSRELCAVNVGYLTGLVEACGTLGVVCTKVQCICDNLDQCIWHVRWI